MAKFSEWEDISDISKFRYRENKGIYTDLSRRFIMYMNSETLIYSFWDVRVKPCFSPVSSTNICRFLV